MNSDFGSFISVLVDPLLYHHGSVRPKLNANLNWVNIFFNVVIAFFIMYSLKCLLTWSYQNKRARHNSGLERKWIKPTFSLV